MPIEIKKGILNVKDSNGNYIGLDVVAQETTDQQIASIQAAGAAQVSAVQQKGVETLESIPDDYTELSGEVADLNNAIDAIEVLPGSTKLSGSDISAATGDVTYSVDSATGALTITNGSTGEYANVRTASNFVQKYLTIGNTYRVYIDAEVASGTPELHIAVRGVNGDTSGIAKRANLTNTMQGVLDFTVDEYMRDIAIFVAYGSSTRNSSVIIKTLTLVRYDVSGADIIARSDIKKLSSVLVDSIIDGNDFEPTQTGITFTVNSETGDITVTNTSSGNYANIATKDATFTQKLTIGATYRLHAKAEILSGFPNMRIAIRGTAGGEQSVATYVPLTAEKNEGFVDFVATKYMKRVTIFMANGSSTRNSSARFSEVWLKKIKDPEPYIVPPFFSTNKPLFRAHNGDEINAPSATMPAFKLACERGYKMIQIARVRQSADGTWYVMHNATIDDTTNGTGSIASLTDEYLATVHIDTGNNVDQYTDDELRIPKLADVLALCRRYGVYPSIRFGSLPSTANTDANLAVWNSLFAETAKYNPMLCMFSGEMSEIRTLKALQPNYYGEIYDSAGTHIDSYLSECISKGYKGICIMSQYSYFTAAQISDIHEAGYQVAVYPGTTWTDDQVIAAVDAGIDIYQDTGTRPDVPIQES